MDDLSRPLSFKRILSFIYFWRTSHFLSLPFYVLIITLIDYFVNTFFNFFKLFIKIAIFLGHFYRKVATLDYVISCVPNEAYGPAHLHEFLFYMAVYSAVPFLFRRAKGIVIIKHSTNLLTITSIWSSIGFF